MNIFVGGSSKDTTNNGFSKSAQEIGKFIVDSKHNLVFGGCNSGLMGITYRTVCDSNGSKIIVTMAKAYKDDLKSIKYDEVYLSDTVNERKNDVFEHSDALIFLPGGIGTIDEIMTAIEADRNHQIDVPIVIINVDGFFDGLLQQSMRAFKENFSLDLTSYAFIVNESIKGINYLKSLGF